MECNTHHLQATRTERPCVPSSAASTLGAPLARSVETCDGLSLASLGLPNLVTSSLIPDSPQSGQLCVGDLVVKVGGAVVWDRCHLNVTTIIKNLSTQDKVSHSQQQSHYHDIIIIVVCEADL